MQARQGGHSGEECIRAPRHLHAAVDNDAVGGRADVRPQHGVGPRGREGRQHHAHSGRTCHPHRLGPVLHDL